TCGESIVDLQSVVGLRSTVRTPLFAALRVRPRSRQGCPVPAPPLGSRRPICDDRNVSVARFGLVVAAVVVGLLAYRVQVDNLLAATTPFRASATLAAAGAFLLAGLIAWARRPANRLGRLMIVAC